MLSACPEPLTEKIMNFVKKNAKEDSNIYKNPCHAFMLVNRDDLEYTGKVVDA